MHRASPDRADRAHVSAAVLLVVPALGVLGFGFAKAASAGVTTADAIRIELTLGWVVAALCLLVRPGAAPPGSAGGPGGTAGRGHPQPPPRSAETSTGGTGHAARIAGHVAAGRADGGRGPLPAVGARRAARSPRPGVVAVVVAYAAGVAFGLWAWFGPGRMTDTAAVIGLAGGRGRGPGRRRPPLPLRPGHRPPAPAAASPPARWPPSRSGWWSVGLSLLVKWPVHPWAIAAGGTVLVPVGRGRCHVPPAARRSRTGCWCRLLTVTGLSAVVLAVYLLVILGFGHEPGPADREVLGLSILAAAIVALGASVSHQRVQQFAQRLVYGTDAVPDDVVKTFSTRLTRAVTMDELLLQLTESLHKSMVLTSAEVFTGSERGARAERLDPRPRARAPCTSDRRSSRWWPGPGCRATPGRRCGCRR